MKLDIQLFGPYADANLVLDQGAFEAATGLVRAAHTQMDDLFAQRVKSFCHDIHAEVWADGNCRAWFSGEFTTKTKAAMEKIAEQFNSVLRGLDSLWQGVADDLSVGKAGDAGSVSTSGNVDVSATQTDTFDDGTSGRRSYLGKRAADDMGQLTAGLAPARHALREAISSIGVYDNLGGNVVQKSVETAIEEINETLSQFSTNISNAIGDVMSMTDEQYNNWADNLKVQVSRGTE